MMNFKQNNAFTLLEIIISMALLALILGGVFAIITSSLDLANETKQLTKDSTTHQNFINIFHNSLQNLPAETKFVLKKKKIDNSYFFSLIFKNCGDFISGSNFMGKYDWLVLETRKQDGGFVTLIAFFLNLSEGQAFEKGIEPPKTKKLDLLNNLSLLDVKLISNVSSYTSTFREKQKKYDYWNTRMGRPKYLELYIKFIGDFKIKKYLFWIPEKVIPKLNLNNNEKK